MRARHATASYAQGYGQKRPEVHIECVQEARVVQQSCYIPLSEALRVPHNPWVVGSSPTRPTTLNCAFTRHFAGGLMTAESLYLREVDLLGVRLAHVVRTGRMVPEPNLA